MWRVRLWWSENGNRVCVWLLEGDLLKGVDERGILTAGRSSEIGIYEVEFLWSFSGLGRRIILEFFHI